MSTPAFPETYAKATGIVKKRVSRWPSAYASGQVVQEYRRLVAATHGSRARPYMERRRATGRLARWFREQWIDIASGAPCGRAKSASYYPVCRPASIARRLTKSHILAAIRIKQRAKAKTARYAWPKKLNRVRVLENDKFDRDVTYPTRHHRRTAPPSPSSTAVAGS